MYSYRKLFFVDRFEYYPIRFNGLNEANRLGALVACDEHHRNTILNLQSFT